MVHPLELVPLLRLADNSMAIGTLALYLFVCAVLLYAAYGAIYRLYLSPVAKIPGRKLAALTFWYEFYYDVVKQGAYVWEIKKMHEKYGEESALFTLRKRNEGRLTEFRMKDPLFALIHTSFTLSRRTKPSSASCTRLLGKMSTSGPGPLACLEVRR